MVDVGFVSLLIPENVVHTQSGACECICSRNEIFGMQDQNDTAIRDRLARYQTELANERTLLAYTRSALGFIVVGIPAV